MAEQTTRRAGPKAAERLYVKGVFPGFKRGLRTRSEHTALLKLEGVFNKDDARFYIGKRTVHLYKAHNKTTKPGHSVARHQDPRLDELDPRLPEGWLYVKGVFSGFKRGLRTQSEHTALLKLEGVFNKDDARFYIGKSTVHLYKAHNKTTKPGHSVARHQEGAIWGRITRVHGNSGIVRAKFHQNLPLPPLETGSESCSTPPRSKKHVSLLFVMPK